MHSRFLAFNNVISFFDSDFFSVRETFEQEISLLLFLCVPDLPSRVDIKRIQWQKRGNEGSKAPTLPMLKVYDVIQELKVLS